MERLTVMTAEEIKDINMQIAELKKQYFDALDSFKFDLADQIHNKIARLNNSIH